MRRRSSMWKGVVAGLVGGLAGSWTMNQFQALLSKLTDGRQSQSLEQEAQEPATTKAAEKLTWAVLHRELHPREKQFADPVVHYGYGGLMGGIYGAVGEKLPQATVAAGLPFATALWLAGDEIAVPALGLSGDPREYPISSHAQALVVHAVYGIATDSVRRLVLKALH